MNSSKINIFSGDARKDNKGILKFVNDFTFKGVKRFYHIQGLKRGTIRAFHGHMKEAKYAYVLTGKILLCAVPLDNSQIPSKNLHVERFVLDSDNPKIVCIPRGYANGFKFLTKNAQILFFSTKTLEDSKVDDYRFPYDYWGKDIWKVKKRKISY